MTSRKMRWIGYGIANIAWFVVFAHDWGVGFAAHLSKTAGIILIVVGFGGSTLNLVGGLRESKLKRAQQPAVNALQE